MKPGPARPGSGDLMRKRGVPFLVCCPAGGLDLRKSCFLNVFNYHKVAKQPYLASFEPQEYARTLSFEKICRMH